MNNRQRQADSEMRYLGRAWRHGYDGPSRNPKSTNIWRQILQQARHLPYVFDDERVDALHARWLAVADQDRYSAAVLKLHYRDGYNFGDSEICIALDLFSRT